MSFEYHSGGDWHFNTLKDTTDFLDGLGYDCYFQVRDLLRAYPACAIFGLSLSVLFALQGQARLFKLTDCWVPELEVKDWSNVVCARRGDKWRSVLESFRVT